jgi:hypothetical protein
LRKEAKLNDLLAERIKPKFNALIKPQFRGRIIKLKCNFNVSKWRMPLLNRISSSRISWL